MPYYHTLFVSRMSFQIELSRPIAIDEANSVLLEGSNLIQLLWAWLHVAHQLSCRLQDQLPLQDGERLMSPNLHWLE